jgi:hypothetical protein
MQFWVYDYFLRTYSNIHSDYSYRNTSVYRSKIVSIVIRVAVATKLAVAKSCATVVGPFSTLLQRKYLVGAQFFK